MDALRILEYPVHAIFVMQVRTRGKSGHADERNEFALTAAAAHIHAGGTAQQVTIARDDALRMVDFDYVAIAALEPHEAHAACARGMHRSAYGRSVVDALMGANRVQDGVHAGQIEGGTHA